VLGVVFAGVVLWISEAIPLGLTALFVLVLLGTVPNAAGSVTFIGFASPVVFFLIGAVAIGAAVEASGLAERLAKLLVRGARGSPVRLYTQMLASLPGLALLLPSAITRNAVLIPAYRDSLSESNSAFQGERYFWGIFRQARTPGHSIGCPHLVVRAVVLAVLRAFISQHYFIGAGSDRLIRIRNRMVRRMVGEPKASESIVPFPRPEIRLGHAQAALHLLSIGGTLPK
jgi:di/tricarboxylate transporter